MVRNMSSVMVMDMASVKCPGCGNVRDVSVRQMRRLRNQNVDARCTLCRAFSSDVKFEQSHRNYWLKRHSMEWIVETAEMIWGPNIKRRR
jgi:predicted RNA-binding Zn-ribbon protein involved in translation (DUF1610 family)